MVVEIKKFSLNELKRLSEKHGYKIRLVGSDKLADYAGMNPMAAKDLGFTMPDDEIWIDKNLSNEVKCETIRHELNDTARMQQGKDYWPAHCDSLKAEKSTHIALPEKPQTSIKKQFQEEPVNNPVNSNFRQKKVKATRADSNDLGHFGIGRIRKVSGGYTRRTRTGRVL